MVADSSLDAGLSLLNFFLIMRVCMFKDSGSTDNTMEGKTEKENAMRYFSRIMFTAILALVLGAVFTSSAEAHPPRRAMGKRIEHRGEVLQRRGFRMEHRSDRFQRKGVRLTRHGHPRAGRHLYRKGLTLDHRADRYIRRGFMMERRGERMERWGERIQRKKVDGGR